MTRENCKAESCSYCPYGLAGYLSCQVNQLMTTQANNPALNEVDDTLKVGEVWRG